MLNLVKSAITCNKERISMFWKFRDNFSPVYPGPCVSLVGSVRCGLTSTTSTPSV